MVYFRKVTSTANYILIKLKKYVKDREMLDFGTRLFNNHFMFNIYDLFRSQSIYNMFLDSLLDS